MRRFNPERELNKIQHGNKNKIIVGVIALLLIISIGSTYALYQLRYSKRIIYTKVAPSSTGDLILSFLVDGQKQPNIPVKNSGYYFDSIECESDTNATANWDYENWKLTALTATVPNKCNIKFTSTPTTLIAQIEHIKETNPEMVIEDETSDKNLRYVGENVDNYIWFNCDNYDLVTNNATAETQKCEKWRIIGLMNNMTIIDERTLSETTNQSLVKIIRAESIGSFVWDSANKNNWINASLQTSLNDTYYNGTNLGNGKGITPSTRKIIEKVKWNLGGVNLQLNNYTASLIYVEERGTTTYNSQPTTWDGYIGLMYPSDYGYATTGSNSETSRDTCLNTSLNSYNDGCYQKDWLFNSLSQWTITHQYPWVDGAITVINSGMGAGGDRVGNANSIRPSLFLTPDVQILNGNGSSGTPYILNLSADSL